MASCHRPYDRVFLGKTRQALDAEPPINGNSQGNREGPTHSPISEWCYLAERLLDNLYGILDL